MDPSFNRRLIFCCPVLWGLGLQLLFGLFLLQPSIQHVFFGLVDGGVHRLLSFSDAGSDFVFQSVEPHQILDGDGTPVFFIGRISPPMKTFAFWIPPTIIFSSSLMSVL